MKINPVLPFLVLLENGKGNHQKNKDIWEKHSKKQGNPRRGKKQGIQKKNKERKDREVTKGTSRRFSEVLSETLLEEEVPLGDSRSCCPPNRVAP